MPEKVLGPGGSLEEEKIKITFEADTKPIERVQELTQGILQAQEKQLNLQSADIKFVEEQVQNMQKSIDVLRDVYLLQVILKKDQAARELQAFERDFESNHKRWKSAIGMLRNMIAQGARDLEALRLKIEQVYTRASTQKTVMLKELEIFEQQVQNTVKTIKSMLANAATGVSLTMSAIQIVFNVFGVQLTPLESAIMQSITSTLTAVATSAAMYEASMNPYLIAIGLAIQLAATAIAISGAATATQQMEVAKLQNAIAIMQMQDARSRLKATLDMVGMF